MTYTNTTPKTCRQGDKGSAVKFMQMCLNRAGFKLAEDGSSGQLTGLALFDFQTKHKLTADKICGAKTWMKLLNGGTTIIHHKQNDPRWSGQQYTSVKNTSQTIGNSGCGPTSLAIAMSAYGCVVMPPELCVLAVAGGFRTANSGTSWGFFAAVAPKFGRKAAQVTFANALEALKRGKVVVASMGAGDYTKSGHYICLRDYDPYNEIIYTLDPVSGVRNSCTTATIRTQGKAFWVVE